MTFPFVKGHGTRNDFIILPDLDGSRHGDLSPAVVRELCDRRAGLGADGVLRVLRGNVDGGADWFMDYRNADGSVSQMCGNGVRVFARYLAEEGLVDPAAPLAVDTRAGVKEVRFCPDGEISVDMGRPTVGGMVPLRADGRWFEAMSVDMGNPHAVVHVDSLDEAGALTASPVYRPIDFPDGVNVEFVHTVGDNELAMRVYERGAGETLSCGTGACASVAAAMAVAVERGAGSRRASSYTVNVRGGVLTVRSDDAEHLHLKGDAALVAEGTWTA